MSESAANQIQYYLGIEGEQKGPFSYGEVFQMLSNGEIDNETPIWFLGMNDWASVGSLEQFKGTPQNQPEPPSPSLTSTNSDSFQGSKLSSQPSESKKRVLNQALEKNSEKQPLVMETVFPETANFKNPDLTSRFTMMIVGAVVLVGAAAAFFWINSQTSQPVPVVKKAVRVTPEEKRKNEFRSAQIKYSKNPDEAISELTNILSANPSDNVGLESLEMLLSYYRQRQLNSEVGRILLMAKRPVESLEYFLKDPPDYMQAEKAYEEAANLANGNQKKEYLLKQIDLLINRLNQTDKAVARIQTLEKEFPGTSHPYQYYLKNTDQKISDIFSRVSFHFSETLSSFLNGELPQLQFEGKPLLQITKDSAGKYRVVGTYKGQVFLRNDKLPNIYFVFWLANEQWTIVDTNLTKERAIFAQQEQKKHISDAVSDLEMLQFLESLFKTRFAGKGLHEIVTPVKRQSPGTIE